MNLSTTDYALLGLLTVRPMSGYELKQFAEQSVGHFWSESYGQIYPALQRLARAGYIRQLKPDAESGATASRGGRERRTYALNPSGKKALEAWLPEPARAQVPRSELLLKLFFGSHLGFKASREHLRELERVQQARLKAYLEIDKKLKSSIQEEAAFWRITLRNGILVTQATLAWIDESLEALDRMKKARKRSGKMAGKKEDA
jgi:DNA-binding PadR family transcriptional regulator